MPRDQLASNRNLPKIGQHSGTPYYIHCLHIPLREWDDEGTYVYKTIIIWICGWCVDFALVSLLEQILGLMLCAMLRNGINGQEVK
jgi:hypothetical protein